MTTVYKIRHKETGLFSTGGMWHRFTTVGKVWSRINHVRAHLALFSQRGRPPSDYHLESYLDQIEIVEYDLVEKSAKDVSHD